MLQRGPMVRRLGADPLDGIPELEAVLATKSTGLTTLYEIRCCLAAIARELIRQRALLKALSGGLVAPAPAPTRPLTTETGRGAASEAVPERNSSRPVEPESSTPSVQTPESDSQPIHGEPREKATPRLRSAAALREVAGRAPWTPPARGPMPKHASPCPVCGTPFLAKRVQGGRFTKTCSRKCGGFLRRSA